MQSKSIGLGQFIQPGEKLARIYSTDVAEIRLPLATSQLGFLDLPLGDPRFQAPTRSQVRALRQSSGQAGEQGPKVSLSAEFAGAMQTWQGSIVRTEGALDESTGVLYAVAEVQNPYQQKDNRSPLLSGLFVQAEIEGKSIQGIFTLPQMAMNAAQEVMLVDASQKLRIRRVDVLRNEPDRVLVNGGLNAGDLIVISGIDVPVDGMTVRVDKNTRSKTTKADSR